MNLFKDQDEDIVHLISADGIVDYYGRIFTGNEADRHLGQLLNEVQWKNDEAVIFGKRIITKRKVAWYGDHDYEYTYSKVARYALPWTEQLLQLKKITEAISGAVYNSCLLNLYHDGSEGMAWHSDAEKDLVKNAAIASLSFGAARRFSFRHKITKETLSLQLDHGSLLVMKGTTQSNWLHRLPPSKLIARPRVNLTFRTIAR